MSHKIDYISGKLEKVATDKWDDWETDNSKPTATYKIYPRDTEMFHGNFTHEPTLELKRLVYKSVMDNTKKSVLIKQVIKTFWKRIWYIVKL